MDSGDSNTTQQPNTPTPCSKGCGFFGNPLTENMCSKCFRNKKEETVPNNDNNINSTNSTNKKDIEINKQTTNAVVETAKLAEVEEPTTTAEEEKEKDTKKVQTDTTKCFSCNKKVGLLGFKCRCSFVYCSTHRYSNKHDCSFDYKSAGKEQLAKDNPTVMASKINKI
ncbi:hypothetical protein RB653_003100 [Dictyostelium firmibasis]|uniref:Zinc finger protein n=1 Tax=Dictyostelium firmibasis TaxID=79012 RepID=A0AAN7TPY9_9MYCE